jgi:hypothetical protein
MKRFIVPAVIVGCLLVGVVALADDMGAKKKGKPMMARYLVTAPHTAEQCLTALDAFDTGNSLAKFDFGCEDGDHTGYAIVNARTADEAKMMVPESERANVKVVMLHKFTAAELKSFHEKMMEHK